MRKCGTLWNLCISELFQTPVDFVTSRFNCTTIFNMRYSSHRAKYVGNGADDSMQKDNSPTHTIIGPQKQKRIR